MSAETEKDKENKEGKKTFVERIFHDDLEGEYDDEGFFTTPNGSFWDPDGVYFNREGYDKHGGYYDDNDEYVPGKGWDEENNCYINIILWKIYLKSYILVIQSF